jgi:opacity protein-like surface antigen
MSSYYAQGGGPGCRAWIERSEGIRVMNCISRLCKCMLAFFVLVSSVSAQDKHPSAEIFGGYSYLNFQVKLGFDPTPVDRQSAQGVGINAAINLSNRLGIIGDGSYNAKGVSVPSIFGSNKINVQHTYFLFGPRLSFRGGRATGFLQTLVGGAHIRDEFGSPHKTTDLALAIGGGVDLKISKRLALRALQVDYLPSRRRLASSSEKDWLQNLRAQVGIVFRFGGD